MEKIIEILKNIHPEVDYEKEKGLIDKRIFDSFDVLRKLHGRQRRSGAARQND